MGGRKDGNREGVVNKLDSGNMFFFPLWSWHEKLRRFYFFFERGWWGRRDLCAIFTFMCLVLSGIPVYYLDSFFSSFFSRISSFLCNSLLLLVLLLLLLLPLLFFLIVWLYSKKNLMQ